MVSSEIINLTLNRLQNFDYGETDFSRPALLVKEETGITENNGRYAILTRDSKLDEFSDKVKVKISNAFLQNYNGKGIQDILLINWKEGETIEEALISMEDANPKQYWAICSSIEDISFDRTEGLKPLIQFCMNNDRFYFMSYFQVEAFITTIKTWQDLSYQRVFAIYSSQENCNNGIDLALGSLLVSSTPGNLTAKFKSLINFSPDDDLKGSDKNLLKENHINIYVREGSKNSNTFLITEGTTIDNDYFDFVFGLDYMQVQIVNELRTLFVTQKNIDIGFNARGYALIKSAILTALNPFVINEFINDNIQITISEPSQIPSDDFKSRILRSVSINIEAIQKIHTLIVNLNQGLSTNVGEIENTAQNNTRSFDTQGKKAMTKTKENKGGK